MAKDSANIEAARVLASCLSSPNVSDSNGEPANVVDVGAQIASQLRRVASAITPISAVGGNDASGGHVESLTEAVMGMTSGLFDIATAIRELADAVKEQDRG